MRSVAESCMHNRANTLAMLACLEVCREQKPYRNAEAEIDALPVMDMTTQNAHALIKALVEAGGIIRIDVPENESENLAVCAGEESADSNEQNPSAKPQDQPTDYLLQTTEEGLLALDELSSEKRFADLIATEPEGYRDAYARVLEACITPLSLTRINDVLKNHPALESPKRIYPEYFVTKLETIAGLTWEGAWHTTEAGRRMLETLRTTSEPPRPISV